MSEDDHKSRRDEAIDAQLRRAFEVLTEREMPDRFSDLLRKLRLDDDEDGDGSQGSSDIERNE